MPIIEVFQMKKAVRFVNFAIQLVLLAGMIRGLLKR